MFRALALFLLLLASPAFAQSGGAVKQSGTITRDHATKWVNDGVIGDAGGFPVPLCAPLPTNFSAPFATITTNSLGCATITQGGTGPGGGNVLTNVTLTNNALLIGLGTNLIGVLNSLGTTTTVLHGNAGGPPSFGPVTAVDMAAGAALGNIGAGGITPTYLAGGAALANIGAGNITNTYLANPSMTINSVTCTLGGSCTVSGGGGDTITSPNSTLTVGGTPTNTTLDLNLSHANTWLAAQQIPNLVVTGSLTAIGLVTNTDLAAGAALANIGLNGVTNSYLASPTITVNGTPCTLGSSCAPSGAGVSVTSSTPNTIVVTPTPGTTTFTIGTIQTTIDCTAGTITGNCTGGAALIAGYSGANVQLGAHAYTIAQAGTTGFDAGWGMCVTNTGTSGDATVTTTTSVFLGSGTNTSSLTLAPSWWACLQSKAGDYVVNIGNATGGGTGSGTVSSGTGPAIAQYDVGTGTTVVASTISKDATLAQGGALTLASSNGTRADLGLNVNGALKVTTAGAASQAACADLSNGAASCSTDTTNAANISSGTLAAARMLPLTTGQVYLGNGSNQPASTPFATPAKTYLDGLPAGSPVKLVGVDGANNIVTQTPFVTDVALTPGLTTTVGVCNTSLQHITATGQINQQDCYRTVTTSTSGSNADSGWTVKMNCVGCVYTAINPTGSGGNQGVFFDLIGDGNASDSYVVTTAAGTANFLGCPLGGSTSMTIPGNVNVRIVSNPDNNATNYYQCIQGNGTVSVTNNYSGNPVLLHTLTATSGSTTELDFVGSNWSSSYNTIWLKCTKVLPSVDDDDIVVQVTEDGGSTWKTGSSDYKQTIQYLNSSGTPAGSRGDRSYLADLELSHTIGGSFQLKIDAVASTTIPKHTWFQINYVRNGDSTLYNLEGAAYYQGDLSAINGIRVFNDTGGHTFGAVCTLSGEN